MAIGPCSAIFGNYALLPGEAEVVFCARESRRGRCEIKTRGEKNRKNRVIDVNLKKKTKTKRDVISRIKNYISRLVVYKTFFFCFINYRVQNSRKVT